MVSIVRVLAIFAVAAALVGGVAGSGMNTPRVSRVLPNSIEFSNETTGIASFRYGCADYDCWEVVGRTTDGGHTWTIEPRLRAVEERPIVDVVNPHVAFTWEYSETGSRLLRSDDAGTSWVEQTSPCPRSEWIHTSFVSPARGWMLCRITIGVGTQGDQVQATFETRDAARTWHRVGGMPPILSGIELVPGAVWAWASLDGAWDGRIFESALGRLAWRRVGFDTFDEAKSETIGLESFDAVSADIAYALVRRESERLHRFELRRTTTRGRSWTTVHKWSFAWAYSP